MSIYQETIKEIIEVEPLLESVLNQIVERDDVILRWKILRFALTTSNLALDFNNSKLFDIYTGGMLKDMAQEFNIKNRYYE